MYLATPRGVQISPTHSGNIVIAVVVIIAAVVVFIFSHLKPFRQPNSAHHLGTAAVKHMSNSHFARPFFASAGGVGWGVLPRRRTGHASTALCLLLECFLVDGYAHKSWVISREVRGKVCVFVRWVPRTEKRDQHLGEYSPRSFFFWIDHSSTSENAQGCSCLPKVFRNPGGRSQRWSCLCTYTEVDRSVLIIRCQGLNNAPLQHDYNIFKCMPPAYLNGMPARLRAWACDDGGCLRKLKSITKNIRC